MWYVIQVEACHENEMVTRCQRIVKEGEEVFTMLSERMERRDNEWKPYRYVTFQKYIFVDTAHPDDFKSRLHEITGMTKMLMTGDDITPLYPEEEKLLKRLGGDDHVIGKSCLYSEGDEITVINGPLVGLEGVVKWKDKRQRLIGVAVTLMNRETIIKLAAEYIRKK